MQSIDNVLKLRKGLKPDDPNPDIFDILWAKKLSSAGVVTTLTGNPLSFLAKKAQIAKSTKVTLESVQDLHGYDNPWPAGGGKNKFNATGISQYCTLNNGVYTLNSLPESTISFNMGSVSFKAGNTYILSGGYSNDFRVVFTYDGTSYISSTGDSDPIVVTTDGQVSIYGVITKTATVNSKIYPMIRLSSDDSSYTPYSNICPISGRTGVEIKGCGSNVFGGEIINGYCPINEYLKNGVEYYVLGDIITQTSTYLQVHICNKGVTPVSGQTTNIASVISNTTIVARNFTADLDVYDYYLFAIASYTNIKNVQITMTNPTQDTYEPYAESNDVTITFPAVGYNQWDEVWEKGAYDNITGEKVARNNLLRIKEPIKVKSSTEYYLVIGSTSGLNILQYDVNGNYLGVSTLITNTTSRAFTTNQNTAFITFYWIGTEYSNDISINYPATATTYEPYTNTVYGGTLDVETGVLTVNKIGVDMGALEWKKGTYVFYATLQNIKTPNPNTKCSIYKYRGYSVYTQNIPNSNYSIQASGHIYLRDNRYSKVLNLKTAISGQKLIYELATPRTIQLTPEQIQILKGQNTIWIEDEGATIALTYKN